MRFDQEGAQHFRSVFTAEQLEEICASLSLNGDRPVTRIRPPGLLRRLLSGPSDLEHQLQPLTNIATNVLGAPARPVRAVYFDKPAGRDWAIGWYQDATIAVRRRKNAGLFFRWTVKSGIHHVAPPIHPVLLNTLNARIYFDPVADENGPPQIAPHSHQKGKVFRTQFFGYGPQSVTLGEPVSCLAEAGDVWVFATTLIHCATVASVPRRRRMLQVSYAANELPDGLEWLGV